MPSEAPPRRVSASTPVPRPPGSERLFTAEPTNGVVRVSANTWGIVSALAELGADEAARRTRERELGAAVSDGRITASAKAAWRARYNDDREGTRAALKALTPGTASASAASGTTEDPWPSAGASRQPAQANTIAPSHPTAALFGDNDAGLRFPELEHRGGES